MSNLDLTNQTIKSYHIRELINQGGFGAVYRAYQIPLDRDVAIKVILPLYANQPEFIRRFEVEAHLVARLEHLHIVPLYDYWRDPDGAYLVMRWLRGGSLRQYVRRGSLPIPFVVRVVEQITAALHAAHQKNIIHQDIKPDNLLLDADNNAYLADFGIAKEAAQARDGTELHGTLSYIAPELFMGEPASPQSDIYSMGITLFELLTGKHPFNAKGIAIGQFSTDVPLLQDFQPNLPNEFNTVIQRTLTKNPRDRYTSALALAADFRRIASRHAALEPAVSAAPQFQMHGQSSPSTGTTGMTTGERSPISMHTLPFTPDIVTTRVFESEAIQENPFKGLRPFEEADALNFFGQERRLEQVIGVLASRTSTHFLALVGASGSGKTSLVKAGLIPTLRHGGLPDSEKWFYVDFTPGAQPFIKLQAALLRVATNPPTDVLDEVRKHEHGLSLALDVVLPRQGILCLFIDQFEELFTLVKDEAEQTLFLRSLARAALKRNIWIIITLRADFYDRPLHEPLFGSLIQDNTLVILPPNDMEMERAITRPTERVGLMLEHGLVELILEEIQQQPVKLPLLQYALTELFERRKNSRLTVEAYHEFGGVIGALARRADDLFDSFNADEQRLTRQIFLRLVSLGEGMEDTRRRVRYEDILALPGERAVIEHVLDTFGQYRLLTFDHDPYSRAPTVEIAHEALIQKWERLHDWIEQSRTQLQIQRQLAAASAEWAKSEQDASYLVRGARLSLFESLCDSDFVALTPEEHLFLDACIAARQRANARLRVFVAGLIGVALGLFVLTIFAFDQRQNAIQAQIRADNEARASRSRELAVNALTNIDTLDRALLLSLAALDVDDTFEARNSLLTGLQAQPSLISYLHGAESPVRSIALSADDRWLAAGEADGAITVWSVETRTLAWRTVGHSGVVNTIAIAGNLLVSAGSDSAIRWWRLDTGEPVETVDPAHDDKIWSLAFSPDGQMLASGDEAGILIWWDMETREPHTRIETDHESIWRVVYSPTDPILASSGADNRIQLWDAETGEPIGTPLEGHTNWVWALAFSPDGQTLASSGADRTILLWNVETRDLIAQLPTDHTHWIRDLDFSPDGTRLISSGMDGDIRVWDMDSGTLIGTPLTAHEDEVWSAAYASDGAFFASDGLDGNVMLWTPDPLDAFTHDAPVTALALQPDGGFVAVGDFDGEISLYDAVTNAQSPPLTGHTNMILNMAFGSGWLATTEAGTSAIFVWDIDTRTSRRLSEHTGLVYGLAAQGDLLLSGGEDGRVVLWNMPDGTSRVLYDGEAAIQSVDLAATETDTFAISGDTNGFIRLWTVSDGTQIGEFQHAGSVSAVALSADGTLLAVGGDDGSLQLWNVTTGQPLSPISRQHGSKITDLAFQAGNRLLASSSEDRTVLLWDIPSGRVLGQPLRGHDDWVLRLAFSPDGSTLFSGGYDGRVIRWDTAFDSWRRRACTIANRNFTDEEHRLYPLTGIQPCFPL